MNESSTRVSIIVINYNTPELTKTLLKSIVDFTHAISYDITVVDNGSDPNLRYKQESNIPNITVIESPDNLGFSRGANLGAEGKSAPYLLFANSDCRLTENVIPQMAAYLDNNPDCAACSPRLESEDGAILSSIRHFPNFRNIRHSRGSILGPRGDYTMVADKNRKKVDALSATFMMTRRELFERVGKFDERFFMYVEDTDLCKKYYDLNKHVMHLGDLRVIHHWGASSSRRPLRMKLQHHRSVLKYFKKHFPDQWFANLFLSMQLSLNFMLVTIKYLLTRR